jgi:hypothetical protein
VVFAYADGIDANLVGKHRLLDQVADHLRSRQRLAVRSVGDVAERVEAEFEDLIHSALLSATSGSSPCAAAEGLSGSQFRLHLR